MTPDPERFKALAVRLQNRQIGVINRLAGDRQLFSFDEDYINDPARPTLSLSFKGGQGTVAYAPRTYSARVPPFFSNLLPEGHLRTYLAAHAGVKPVREFFLLAALGADLPGGLVVAPLADEGEGADSPETPPHDHRDSEPAEPALRFSLAGVQLKFSAILEASGGLTIPAGGMGGSWIVKLPSERFPSVPENEFVMLELARVVGISVPPNRLIPAAQIAGLPRDAARLDGNALAVKRFDRSDGKRVHMEDFAQVFGLFPEEKYDNRSYANIAAVLWAETGERDTYEFLRRLVFSVVIGNGDMHLKNWSLLYPDGRTPELSPAYDFVSTVPYMPDDALGLTFGDSRSLSGITKNQIRRFADTAGLPTSPLWEIVRDTVARTTEAWNALEVRELLPADIRARVQSQIETAARGTEP
ncbi:MAG: type II toxin-antitoxin system HipA family toxin [Myxococcota bacterium]